MNMETHRRDSEYQHSVDDSVRIKKELNIGNDVEDFKVKTEPEELSAFVKKEEIFEDDELNIKEELEDNDYDMKNIDVNYDDPKEIKGNYKGTQHNNETFESDVYNLKVEVKGELTEHPSRNQGNEETNGDVQTKDKPKVSKRSKKSANTNLEEIQCVICPYKTKFRMEMNKHVKMKHTQVEDTECHVARRNPVMFRQVQKSRSNKVYIQCKLCSYETSKKSDMTRHVTFKHTKRKEFECDVCNFKTKYKRYLATHIKKKHTDIDCVACNLCEFKTKHQQELDKHVSIIHSGMDYFECDTCGYISQYKVNLYRHIKSKHLKK